MQTIFHEAVKPKKIRIEDFTVSKRYDTRIEIARYVSRNITRMTDSMIYRITEGIVDDISFEENRKKR